jgi:hypothetical protein
MASQSLDRLEAIVGGGGDYLRTLDLGGSRFGLWDPSAFNPAGMVGVTTTTSLATLSVPPTYSTMGGGSPYSGAHGAQDVAAGAPWSPRTSPLPWVLLFLVVALYGIHKLYFEERRR